LDLAKTQQERLQESTVSGAISRNLFEEKVQEVKSAQAKLEQAKSSAKNLWEEKQQAVQVAQGNLDKAKTAVNPTNAGVTAATERIQQEQAKGKTTLSALQKERETLVQQRLEIQKQLIRTHQELKQAESDLLKSVIRAPIAGTLLQLKLRNPGQIVQSSEAIAQISPFHSSLLIKAYVPAKDISKIKVGQKVQMQVSACPYPDYGTLLGNVKAIAPDALPIGKVDAGITGYEVLIQPKTLSVGRGNHQCYLQSGMEGRADIISQEETLLLFILRKAKLMSNF
jgi:HlyD family secretion protein